MKKSLTLLLFISIFYAVPAWSAEKVTVAVLDLTAKGVPKIVSNAISDIIRSEFVNIGNFSVVERSQMNAILEEQGLQMTGCTDSSCAVQFGKLLSARRIVIGEVSKVGNAIVITARYVNVQSGESLFSSTGKAQSIDNVDVAAKDVANDLATRIVTGDKEVITPVTKAGYYGRGAVPGWGQYYAGRPTRGYVFAGAFALSAIFMGYTIFDYNEKQTAYEDQGPPQSEIDKKYEEWEDAYDMRKYSYFIIGAFYVINWIDIIFFSAPDFSKYQSAEAYVTEGLFYSFDVFDRKAEYNDCDTEFNFRVGVRF